VKVRWPTARTLHVTFDDAFRSVDSVLGVLERLGVPATIFACTKLAERGDHFRVPELSGRLPADEDELLTMPWDTLGGLAERHHDARVQAATHKAGYTGAFALGPPSGTFFPYAFPRVGVYRDDRTIRFMLKTSRSGQTVMTARALIIARARR
jgi:hypothetical protein